MALKNIRVEIEGFLGKDAEVIPAGENGKIYAKFSVGTTTNIDLKHDQFWNCRFWGTLRDDGTDSNVEKLAADLKVGDKVLVTGYADTWADKEKPEDKIWMVNVDKVVKLVHVKKGNSGHPEPPARY